MPDTLSLTDIHFLLFIIPGFITVWSWRYSTHSDKKGDFELLGLSFFWGIVIMAIYATIWKEIKEIERLLKNPYVACVILSIIGSLFAFSLSTVKKKNRPTELTREIKRVFLFLVKKFDKKIK